MPVEGHHHALTIDGISSEIRVVVFDGHEGISELFQFEVVIASDDHAIDFDDVLGKKSLLTIGNGDNIRHVHGIVARFEMAEQFATGRGVTVYRVTLVPLAHELRFRRDNRIFQELKVPEVVKKVLEGAGLASNTDFKLSLQGTYAAREYCVQYHESDWDFVCRLLEEEGIFYFFEHHEDKHVMVIADKNAVFAPITGEATLAYNPSAGALGSIDGNDNRVTRFSLSRSMRTGKVTIRDYDFKKPSLKLESTKASAKFAALEAYDWPGEYVLPADGDGIAQIRSEEHSRMAVVAMGSSICPRLVPGWLFTLSEHPRDAVNEEYLVTHVEHHGMEPGESMTSSGRGPYTNSFEIIPKTVVYRPARVTQRPTVKGVQTAIVVGPAGEEIHVDEHARVKVQFHWDRLGKHDEKSSCWVRVSQIWASGAFGGMFIPRIKDEVVISFEDGDPDRPLIVGRVYHGTNVPPYPLPANKTRSTILSRSTPNGEAGNELRFEDKKGNEEVYIHAQKDETILVENDKNQTIVHDETLLVKHDRTKTIKNDQTLTVEHDDKITVKNDRTETIEHDETVTVKNDRTMTVENDHTETVKNNQTIHVEADQTEKVDGNESLTVGGDQTIKISGARALHVTGDTTEKIDGKLTQTLTGDVAAELKGKSDTKITGDVTTKYSAKLTSEVDADVTLTHKAKHTLKVTDTFTIECGSAKIVLKADGTVQITGVKIEVKGSASVKVAGAQVEIKADATAKIEAGAKLDLKGALVDLNGSGPVKVAGAIVGIG